MLKLPHVTGAFFAAALSLFGFAADADLTSGLKAFDNGDYDAAYRELRPAAEFHGYSAAMNNLGSMYENGWAVERDGAQAAHWYRRAALKGYRKAMYNLGILHAEGQVVARDPVVGAAWLGTAYDHGEEGARAPLKLLLDDMTAEQVAAARELRKEISTLLYDNASEPTAEALTEPPVERSRLMSNEQIVEFFSGSRISYEFRKSTAKEVMYPHGSLRKALAGKPAKIKGEYRDGYYRAVWWVENDMLCVDYAKIAEFDDCFWVERLSDRQARTYSRKTGSSTINYLERDDPVTGSSPEPATANSRGISTLDTTASR